MQLTTGEPQPGFANRSLGSVEGGWTLVTTVTCNTFWMFMSAVLLVLVCFYRSIKMTGWLHHVTVNQSESGGPLHGKRPVWLPGCQGSAVGDICPCMGTLCWTYNSQNINFSGLRPLIPDQVSARSLGPRSQTPAQAHIPIHCTLAVSPFTIPFPPQ